MALQIVVTIACNRPSQQNSSHRIVIAEATDCRASHREQSRLAASRIIAIAAVGHRSHGHRAPSRTHTQFEQSPAIASWAQAEALQSIAEDDQGIQS